MVLFLYIWARARESWKLVYPHVKNECNALLLLKVSKKITFVIFVFFQPLQVSGALLFYMRESFNALLIPEKINILSRRVFLRMLIFILVARPIIRRHKQAIFIPFQSQVLRRQSSACGKRLEYPAFRPSSRATRVFLRSHLGVSSSRVQLVVFRSP